jgi:hypothetical protein
MDTSSDKKPLLIANLSELVKQAIADAVSINRKLGTPIYVMRDGQVVDISGEPETKPQD